MPWPLQGGLVGRASTEILCDESGLCSPLQRHDRQVLAAREVADVQVEPHAATTSHSRSRDCARCVTRPLPSWFEACLQARRADAAIDLVGSRSKQPFVRSLAVVPAGEQRELRAQRARRVRDEQPPRALIPDGPDEPFDQCDAPELTDGAEALADPAPARPCTECSIAELHALIGDQVARMASRLPYRPSKERPDSQRAWLLLEEAESHDAPGVMVGQDGEPPAERPTLRQREGSQEIQKPSDVGTVVRSQCQT